MTLRKAGGNWVDGDQFFDRDAELEALTERVKDGTHTLLTAQRRMGKTSLVRELLRRLKSEGCFETIFVDLEGARTPADAIAEIGVRSKSVQGVQHKLKSWLANTLREAVDRVDTLAVSEVQVKLRAGIDAGNWQQKGDEVFAALAENDQPVVLAIDELPILVNRLLKGDDYCITPERRQAVEEFLSWLRKNGQEHRGRVCLILSGSVGLEPILQQAGLSAHANIFSPFSLGMMRLLVPASPRWLGLIALISPSPSAKTCATGCGVRFPTTCSSSSIIFTNICAGPTVEKPH